jgi:transposase-like protein
MSRQRTPFEIQLIKESAQRRVRDGDAYADIARDLGVSQSTLGNWAAEGRWRKKDIAFEQDEERGKALLARIAETRNRENEEAEKRALKAKKLGEAAMKAMKAADPKGDGTPPGMKPMPTHQLSLAMAHTLLEQGQIGEAERAARLAMRFAQAQKAMNTQDADRWREDRRRIMDWWKTYSEGFIAYQRYAEGAIEDLESRVKFERRAREEGLCPTCIRPADFWPAEMYEVQDAAVERMEDRELAEKAAEAEQQEYEPADSDQGDAGFWPS